MSYVIVFDPSTELYGFQTEPDNPQPEYLPPEQLEPQELKRQPSVDPSPKPVLEPAPSAKGLNFFMLLVLEMSMAT